MKRIIGVPGDRIHLRDGEVYRNGEKLDEPYVLHDAERSDSYRNNFPAVRSFRPGYLYDLAGRVAIAYSRGGSRGSSRPLLCHGRPPGRKLGQPLLGIYPKENMIGRPMFVYWSFETPSDQYQRTSFGDRLGFLAHVVLHFFDETRWRRTLKVVR